MHAPASLSPVVVNGQPFALPQSTLASATLLHVLRNDLSLNGPKYGCGLGSVVHVRCWWMGLPRGPA